MAKSRAIFFKIFIPGCIALSVAILTICSIYWGALWKTPIGQLHGTIVNFDLDNTGGSVGQTVVQAAQAAQSQGRIAWTVYPPDAFPGGPDQVAQAVLGEHTWVALVSECSMASLVVHF